MKLGLFDLFDGAIAELLEIDVETYIRIIEDENTTDGEQEQIIMGILSNDEEQKVKSKELFRSKL
jgi:hypothetical protein